MTQKLKKSLRQKASELLYRPEHIEKTWDRLHHEGGLIPISNQTDTETRRVELKKELASLRLKFGSTDPKVKEELVDDAYKLFFQTADPWFRGLDNRELAGKVEKFGWLYNLARDLPAYLNDLFMCTMHLINLSWQSLDVTNTPWVIIETTPIIHPQPGIDLSGTHGEKAPTKDENV